MKCFVIDPEARTITQSDAYTDYKSIYQLIGADCFDAVGFSPDGDTAYVDDEGLLKPNHFFEIQGYPNPLAGKACILGTNEEGDSVEPKITLEELQRMVTWVTPVKMLGELVLLREPAHG